MPLVAASFIEPDRELEKLADPNEKLRIPIVSGYRAIDHDHHLRGANPIYDELRAKLSCQVIAYEDQCSTQYYFDLVRALQSMSGQFDRLVEVGVFMGGATAIFAGLMGRFDFDLDLVDLNATYLQFTYSRIRRLFPEVSSRIRLFHGNLPSYVKHVLTQETLSGYVVHHDGAHDFTQVTKDLASLSFVREKLVAVIAQDTHLRGTQHMNFVDLALLAVFGTEIRYAPIGVTYAVGDVQTQPNRFEGNYFRAGAPEGMVVPLSENHFQYPHPDMDLDRFLEVSR